MRLPLLLLAAATLLAADPVYITAFRDPLRALEVHRLAAVGVPAGELTVRAGGAERRVPVAVVGLPGTDLAIHRALVEGLEPGSEIEAVFPGEPAVRVRTVPDPAALARPLRVANGGDTMHRVEWLVATARVLCARDPDLIVLGGDLAYEDGRDGRRVAAWIAAWSQAARAPDGRAIPFISCIGNHEVQGGFGKTPAQAPFYFAMLPIGGRAYHAVDVGAQLSFLLLDSGHATPVDGAQEEWLQAELTRRAGRRAIIPVYHYPAWPTVKVPKGGSSPEDHAVSRAIRARWVPRFEAAGVRLVLEHDQHTAKRTVPLKAGQPDPTGITYLGDGAWGVEVRRIHPGLPWLAHGAEVRHGWILEIGADAIEAVGLDETGREFDRTRITLR
jgi:hypothetical protein